MNTCDFSSSNDLDEIAWDGSKFKRDSFQYYSFKGVYLKNGVFTNMVFDQTQIDINEATFGEKTVIRDSQFIVTHSIDVQFENMQMENTIFTSKEGTNPTLGDDKTLPIFVFKNCHLKNIQFDKLTAKVIFSKFVFLEKTIFQDCILEQPRFRMNQFVELTFQCCQMNKANFAYNAVIQVKFNNAKFCSEQLDQKISDKLFDSTNLFFIELSLADLKLNQVTPQDIGWCQKKIMNQLQMVFESFISSCHEAEPAQKRLYVEKLVSFCRKKSLIP